MDTECIITATVYKYERLFLSLAHAQPDSVTRHFLFDAYNCVEDFSVILMFIWMPDTCYHTTKLISPLDINHDTFEVNQPSCLP